MAPQQVATEHSGHVGVPAIPRAASALGARATFGREHHLRTPAEFARVRQAGRSYAGTHLTLGAVRRGEPSEPGRPIGEGATAQPMLPTRVGFTVGKRVGGAVTRNLVRRRLREAVRHCLGRLVSGWDLVVVARPSAALIPGTQLAHDLETLLVRAKVLTSGSERRSR